MIKLKTISLLRCRTELASLPEGKLLINTINAHSYNNAQKDPLFAEALLNGGALIPDGESIVLAFRWLRKEAIERIPGWDLFEFFSVPVKKRSISLKKKPVMYIPTFG